MERGLFQARLEVAFCLAQSPEHEIMAKPKKEEKRSYHSNKEQRRLLSTASSATFKL